MKISDFKFLRKIQLLIELSQSQYNYKQFTMYFFCCTL